MRRSLPFFPFASLVPVLAFALGAGCSAGDDKGSSGGAKDSGSGFDLDGSYDAAIDEDAACGKATYDGLRVPANLLVLFDRSASMQKDSKWDNAVAAIDGAFATADDKLGVGLLLFPAGKFKLPATCTLNPAAAGCAAQWADGGCKDIDTTPNVLVDLLSKTRPQISSVLAGTGPNGDNTPTRWALKNAWAYMQKLSVPGDRYVVLVTDGLPTTHSPKTSAGGITIPESNIECADEKTMEAETSAAAAGSPAVKTFVIGVPGTETGTTFLSSIAFNGKTAKAGCTVANGDCHYQIGSTSFQADLQAVLTDIAGKVASCIFQVPIGTDVQPGYINVSVDTGAGLQPLDQDPSHANGWDYTDASQSRVEIYGPVCDAIKAQKVSNVKILAGCKTRVR